MSEHLRRIECAEGVTITLDTKTGVARIAADVDRQLVAAAMAVVLELNRGSDWHRLKAAIGDLGDLLQRRGVPAVDLHGEVQF